MMVDRPKTIVLTAMEIRRKQSQIWHRIEVRVENAQDEEDVPHELRCAPPSALLALSPEKEDPGYDPEDGAGRSDGASDGCNGQSNSPGLSLGLWSQTI